MSSYIDFLLSSCIDDGKLGLSSPAHPKNTQWVKVGDRSTCESNLSYMALQALPDFYYDKVIGGVLGACGTNCLQIINVLLPTNRSATASLVLHAAAPFFYFFFGEF